MRKLDEIRIACEEAVKEYQELKAEDAEELDLEYGRADLAQEILEILNGENN